MGLAALAGPYPPIPCYRWIRQYRFAKEAPRDGQVPLVYSLMGLVLNYTVPVA
jgi:hypothetical protein